MTVEEIIAGNSGISAQIYAQLLCHAIKHASLSAERLKISEYFHLHIMVKSNLFSKIESKEIYFL